MMIPTQHHPPIPNMQDDSAAWHVESKAQLEILEQGALRDCQAPTQMFLSGWTDWCDLWPLWPTRPY